MLSAKLLSAACDYKALSSSFLSSTLDIILPSAAKILPIGGSWLLLVFRLSLGKAPDKTRRLQAAD